MTATVPPAARERTTPAAPTPGAFWGEVERRRIAVNVLDHPLLERWAAVGPGRDELVAYTSEYDHAVLAIATAARRAARGADSAVLADYAAGEDAHVTLWRELARAAGWGGGAAWYFGEDPLPETEACARAWAGGPERGLAGDLAALAAIEAAQALASRVILEGVLARGFDEGPATEYLRLHARRGGERAATPRAELDGLLPDCDRAALIAVVDDVHRAHWGMLDGLERLVAA